MNKILKYVLFTYLPMLIVLETFSQNPNFQGSAVDETLEEKTFGKEIVEAVIRKIRKSQIFSDDYDLLKRIAFIESNFGEKIDTFRDNFYGGIWQLSEDQFQQTKSGKLENFHAKIKKAFGINWRTVDWKDLLKPLYSGLAMRLLLQSISDSLPQTAEGQAALWQKLFGRGNGTDDLNFFLQAISDLEASEKKCAGALDLTVVLDGSGSIGIQDFETSKDFVINLFSNYSSKNVRMGFIVFGEDAYLIFGLDNSYSLSEILKIVKNVAYPSESTNTNAGILLAVNMIKASTPKPTGTPSIMLVFTDGESNVGDGVSNIQMAKAANITTFAVGIGPRTNRAELLEITYNDASHILSVNNYNTLITLAHRINAETCLVNHRPDLNDTFNDELSQHENRYFTYPITEKGLIVKRNNVVGKVDGYWSFSDSNPSKSVHDGMLEKDETFIPSPGPGSKLNNRIDEQSSAEDALLVGGNGAGQVFGPKNQQGSDIDSQNGNKINDGIQDQVYISMIGRDVYNNYTIECFVGNGTHADLLKISTTTTAPTTTRSSTNPPTPTTAITTTTTSQWPTGVRVTPAAPNDPDEDSLTNGFGFSSGNFKKVPPNFGSFSGKTNANCRDNHVNFMAFPGRCDLYTLCACGVKVLLECAPGLYFDSSIKACNFIQLVDCKYSTSNLPTVIRRHVANNSSLSANDNLFRASIY